MDIQEFLGIAVVGALLSLALEYITGHVKSKNASKAITLVLSLVVAGGYVWVRSTPYFETMVTVLGVASIVYGFVFNKEKV
jgi:hypothetical protein